MYTQLILVWYDFDQYNFIFIFMIVKSQNIYIKTL